MQPDLLFTSLTRLSSFVWFQVDFKIPSLFVETSHLPHTIAVEFLSNQVDTFDSIELGRSKNLAYLNLENLYTYRYWLECTHSYFLTEASYLLKMSNNIRVVSTHLATFKSIESFLAQKSFSLFQSFNLSLIVMLTIDQFLSSLTFVLLQKDSLFVSFLFPSFRKCLNLSVAQVYFFVFVHQYFLVALTEIVLLIEVSVEFFNMIGHQAIELLSQN